jgi:hypothetical protein
MAKETEMPSGIFVSAGRLKATIDLMDSDITITSDGEKMSISSATGKLFVGLLYPLDQGIMLPKGTWSSISLSHLKRLLVLLPSDQLRREEMAAMIETEGGKRIPPEIMELTISLTPGVVEFALDFNQFAFDEVKLRLPAVYSESEDGTVMRISTRKRISRTAKNQSPPEPPHKLDTVTIGNQRDLKPAQ